MKMHPVEIEQALETLTLIVDTREHQTEQFNRRLKLIGLPYVREKLDFGDYSVRCKLPSGEGLSLADKVVIERKMSLDELAQCYTRDRKRFKAEFERAKEASAKIYLLVENASWEMAYDCKYTSRVLPKALVASMTAWLARYNCQLIMCQRDTAGLLIKEILYREMKERIEIL